MSYKIKARQVIITDANDFFRYCKDEYETQPAPEESCQHYRVIFQFLHPSAIRHHQDCDLDQGITGTCSLYSVRNTEHLLKLKVRHIPCLCQACIEDNGGQCTNSSFTDLWRDIDLVPVKGESKRKHQKRKHPRDCVGATANDPPHVSNMEIEPEVLPDIVMT